MMRSLASDPVRHILVVGSATGPVASVERCSRHVGFTPDSGRIAASQRTDAMGHVPTLTIADQHRSRVNPLRRAGGGLPVSSNAGQAPLQGAFASQFGRARRHEIPSC